MLSFLDLPQINKTMTDWLVPKSIDEIGFQLASIGSIDTSYEIGIFEKYIGLYYLLIRKEVEMRKPNK